MSVHEALLGLLDACGIRASEATAVQVSGDSKELEVSAELHQLDENGKVLTDGHDVLTRTVHRRYLRVGAEDWQLVETEADR